MELATIERALLPVGLVSRGGFYPRSSDAVPPLPDGRTAATVVLVGNVGHAMWQVFRRALVDSAEPHPLNTWTRRVLTPVAGEWGAHVLFPFEGPPYLPFLRWAQRAESVTPSPIGPLIHPDYGLWHAYRGALVFAESMELPPLVRRPSPCESCAGRPCLSACPVDALAPGQFDVDRCRDHIASEAGSDCLQGGCLARRACPVGAKFRYPAEQAHFHTLAFLKSR
jgi:hypothetical protein